MKHLHTRLLAAGLLAAAGLAMAQTPTPPTPATSAAQAPVAGGPGRMMGGHGDPAQWQQRRAERHQQRLADLKAKLKIGASQEAAWTSFTTAMQPPARPLDRAQWQQQRAEFEKLTTPERIDRMRAFKSERDTEMNKRADAVKAFYGNLNAEQKKTFDAESLRYFGGGKGGFGRGHHGHHGGMGMMGPGGMGMGPGMGAGPNR